MMNKKIMNKIADKKIRKWIVLLTIIGVALLSLQLSFISAQEQTDEETGLFAGDNNMAFIGAGLAVGVAGLGAGIAIYGATAAGAAAITERPETFVYILIFAGLGEGIAIYGLVVAIMILGKI